MRQFNIRQYVAWLTFAPLLAMAVILESYFLHDHFAEMDRGMREKGELIIHHLASSSEYGVFSNNLEFLQSIAEGALRQEDVRGVVIFDADFGVLARAGHFSDAFSKEIIERGGAANPCCPPRAARVGEA